MSDDAPNNDHNSQCMALWRLLSEYADGYCPPEDTATVERHVAACPECAADLAFLRASSATLRSAPQAAPPPGLREAILAATVGKPSTADRFRRAFAALLAPVPARALAFTAVACAIALGLMRPSINERHSEFAVLPAPDVAAVRGTLSSRRDQTAISPSLRKHKAPAPQVHARRTMVATAVPAGARVLIASAPIGVTPRVGAARSSAQPLGRGVAPIGADGDAAPSDHATAQESESNAMPTEPETPAAQPAPTVTASSAPGGDSVVRTTMVSSTYTGPGQMTKLADVCSSGRLQAAGRQIASTASPRGQIRFDVIRGGF